MPHNLNNRHMTKGSLKNIEVHALVPRVHVNSLHNPFLTGSWLLYYSTYQCPHMFSECSRPLISRGLFNIFILPLVNPLNNTWSGVDAKHYTTVTWHPTSTRGLVGWGWGVVVDGGLHCFTSGGCVRFSWNPIHLAMEGKRSTSCAPIIWRAVR